MARKSIVLVVCGMAAAAVLAPTLPGSAATVPAAAVQPRSVAPSSTLAVIKTISTTGQFAAASYGVAAGVAINDVDDTVYVANSNSRFLTVINGQTGAVDDTVVVSTTSQGPVGVGVNEEDDTVYVSNFIDDALYIVDGRTQTVDDSVSGLDGSAGVAVNQQDDTVYVTNQNGTGSLPRVYVINGRTGEFDDSITYNSLWANPKAVAVDQDDDTVYVANDSSNARLAVWNGRFPAVVGSVDFVELAQDVAVNNDDDTVYVATNKTLVGSQQVLVVPGGSSSWTNIPVGSNADPRGIAVDQNDDTVYFVSKGYGTVRMINGGTSGLSDDSVRIGSSPYGVAVDDSGTNAGLVYVTYLNPSITGYAGFVSVLGRVSPSLDDTLAEQGDSVTLNVDVPQVAYDVDDSTVVRVAFGNNNATNLDDTAGDAWTMTVPAGSGTVDVTVTFNGGLTASAGSFTYGSGPGPGPGPAPAPVYPPSAPRDVTATAGERAASVSWTAPADSGSYPVTDYQVIASPGGRACLVAAPALTCEVTGLTAGVPYTFTAKALNGAGWSPASTASDAVTPTAPMAKSILISGWRPSGDPGRVRVSGMTTGLVGQRVTPWIRPSGQSEFTEGVGVRTADSAGAFAWTRQTSKRISVYFTSGKTKSNTVTIAAR